MGSPTRAVEPPATRWVFPTTPLRARGELREVVGIGADLEPGTLLSAYRTGVFPMPARRGVMAWWSPDPRGIIPLEGLRVSRSLRRSCARFEVRVDTACAEVIDACAGGGGPGAGGSGGGDDSGTGGPGAGPRRPGDWIDQDIRNAYVRLHEWGWVHSVEAWDAQGSLAGGLYGVCIGGFFAGESMFYRQTDASKVALVGLVGLLRDCGAALLDVQWVTPHLRSLGAVEISRSRYLDLLASALARPQPAPFGGQGA